MDDVYDDHKLIMNWYSLLEDQYYLLFYLIKKNS